MPLSKEEFLQEFILARASYDRSTEELLHEALKVWVFIKKESNNEEKT